MRVHTLAVACLACQAAMAASVAPPTNQGWLVPLAELRVPAAPDAMREAAELRKAAASRSDADVARIRWWSAGGPAYRWNEIATEALLDEFVTLPIAARHLALVHVAIDDAVAAAAADQKRYRRAAPRTTDPRLKSAARTQSPWSYPSDYAAAAAAAAEVLSYVLPARASEFAARAEEATRMRLVAGLEYPSDLAAGREIGRKVAALAIARGKADGSDAKWTGAVPTESGKWQGTNPIAPMAGTWKPWVLARADEVRPPPPPAYDSAQGKAELAELKAYARSPRSNHRATYWEVFGGARAYALWNDLARTKLLEYQDVYDGAAGAHVLATLNVAFIDSAIACWEAKYAYWQMRPSHFDADLKTVFAPPNHPSYPAAHGCLSTAAATVLAVAFPGDAESLRARGKEAAEARVWAGIHTRADINAGQELGLAVAKKALTKAGWVTP
jgi:membrane-associated phospholipid phosphatase